MPFIFDVKVFPSSGRKSWTIDKSGNLKCYLKSPAEQGKANNELIKTLAKVLGVSQNVISIISGAQSQKKRIKVEMDMTFNQFLEFLGIDWQMDMF
ncbi:MAG TPA: DUF167 domain-containing protein [Candidatus Babeliales bacterium]|jgi:hypothetical protein|nr:DUF167 domain-containing protein [Candidatus Babeliales bacterium]